MEKIIKMSGVLRSTVVKLVVISSKNTYYGVYQEELFKKTCFSERLEQLLVNKRNI